jgi:hypothetical protein
MSELFELEQIVQRVRELHQPPNNDVPMCEECVRRYPCPTIEALDGVQE